MIFYKYFVYDSINNLPSEEDANPTNDKEINIYLIISLYTKAVFGSRKIFSRKYLFSGNAIFRKGKYFQVFGCIMKIALENIFMCLVTF